MKNKLKELQINVSNLYLQKISLKHKFVNFTDLYNWLCEDLKNKHKTVYYNIPKICKMINYSLIDLLNTTFDNNSNLFVYASIVRLYNSETIYMNDIKLYKYINYIESDLYVLYNLYLNNSNYKSDLYINYNFILFKKI